jgi:ketosteroid isomerase-like protein
VSEADNVRTAERFLTEMNAGNIEVMDETFTDDSVMAYPQSGEVIRGAANRQAMYAASPGIPKITPYRTTASGNLVVTEASLEYASGDTFQTIFIFEFRDGRIAVETAYWAKPFPAAAWRAPWVEKS